MISSTNSSIKNAKVISIISTKGGVGKTITAANLGMIISDINKKVLLIDLDNQPTLSSYFNLTIEQNKALTI